MVQVNMRGDGVPKKENPDRRTKIRSCCSHRDSRIGLLISLTGQASTWQRFLDGHKDLASGDPSLLQDSTSLQRSSFFPDRFSRSEQDSCLECPSGWLPFGSGPT